jgi:hypothetical protein
LTNVRIKHTDIVRLDLIAAAGFFSDLTMKLLAPARRKRQIIKFESGFFCFSLRWRMDWRATDPSFGWGRERNFPGA